MKTGPIGRALAVVASVAAGWLALGGATAWADTTIDTTGCPVSGFITISQLPQGGFPAQQNSIGNEFTAPSAFLSSWTANLASDGTQGATIALYRADSAGPIGAPLWTAPATLASTGSTSTYRQQTFGIDQPVVQGDTYAFVITASSPTADVYWSEASQSAGACSPGPLVDTYAGQPWLPPLAGAVLTFIADFETTAPPQLSPSSVSFAAQPPGTIGDVQTVTITGAGQGQTTLGQVSVGGTDAGDFLVVDDQCSWQTLNPGSSCTVGLRFAPQADGATVRDATLKVPYEAGPNAPAGAALPATGVAGDALEGTAQPAASGSAGAAGPQGPAGAPGRAGSDGRIELVVCTALTTRGRHGGSRRLTAQRCRARLVSGTVTFNASSVERATLTRGRIVYAVGVARGAFAQLRLRRALRAGTYTLTERGRRGSERTRVRIA